MAFSFFGKKSDDTDAKKPKSEGPVFSPDKARVFFEQAKIKQEVGSFDYALNLWLNGLRLDPSNLGALQAFFNCAAASGMKEPTKDLRQIVDGSTEVHKALAAWLMWSFKPMDPDLAVRAAVAPLEAGLRDSAAWVAPKALQIMMQTDRPKKGRFIDLLKVFYTLEDYTLAARAGEGALKLDPSDVQLSNDVRDFLARGTMSKGGYENTGEAGGFRSNIRDQDKQRRLDEADRLTKSENVLDSNVAYAKAEYEARPSDKPTIKKYLEALMARKTADDVATAVATATKAFEQTQEFQFRKLVGDIQMKVGRARLKRLREQADSAPGDAQARQAFVDAEAKQLALEISELELVAKNYPTDLGAKFELGQRYKLAGRLGDAVAQFQVAKNDGRYRAPSLNHLAETFLAMGWLEEAVTTYRQALENHQDHNDEPGMALRYGLMDALLRHAEGTKDLPAAEEGEKIASAIAIQSIQYRDIVARRSAAKALIAKLKAG